MLVTSFYVDQPGRINSFCIVLSLDCTKATLAYQDSSSWRVNEWNESLQVSIRLARGNNARKFTN